MSGRRTVFTDVPGLAALARAHDGVLRRDQLAELGVTRHHVAQQVRARRWQTLGTQVVVLSTGVLTRRQQMYVGTAQTGPRGALAGRTALEFQGLQGWDEAPIHTVVPHGLVQSTVPGVIVHQARHLDECDIARRPGPRSVTAARAAIDAAGWLRQERSARGLILAVAQQRLATPSEMLDVLERIWRVRHTAAIRETLAEAIAGSESQTEVDVLRMMRSIGFRDVQRQVRIGTAIGSERVDLAVRLLDGRMLVVEVDGPSHDDPRQRMRDRARDAALTSVGCVLVRIPVTRLRTDEADVRAQLRAIWMANRAA